MAETPREALPKPAVEMGRLAVLDWWGVTVGGVDEPVARLLREAAPEPAGPASVLGTDRTASPVTAALWNGTASHALDYDDTVLALPGHVTAPLLPGLLALAETRGTPGGDVLAAFVLGVEVMCRVSRALAPGHYRAGWHATATLGRLGAAAACARLLGLDASGDRPGSRARGGPARPGFTSRSATWASLSRSAARPPTGFWPACWRRAA